MKPLYRKLSVTVIFFTSILLIWFFTDMHALFSFQNIIKHRQALVTHIAQHPLLDTIIFVLLYTALVTVALPVTILLTVSAGCLFGPVTGTILSIIGATSGAVCGFMLVRFWLGPWIQPKLAALPPAYRQWLSWGPYYLFIVRCIPVVPFGVATALAAISGMPLAHFMLATLLGVIPTKLIFISIGTQCACVTSLGDLFSLKFMLYYGIIIICATLPLLVNLYTNKGRS